MIVVTGGAGFIGSSLVKYLNECGRTDIVIIDDLTDGRKFANLEDLVYNDYIDVDDSWINMSHVEKVYHIGGISSTTETNGKLLMKYNYQSTKQWYDRCQFRNIPLVYTSSASVYGNSTTFQEDDIPNPLNCYAYSKYLSEQYILSKGCANTWIFRPFNVYGTRETFKDNQASPHTKFKKQFEESGYVEVFEGSDNIHRDFISVDDVVKVLVDSTKTMPGLYNLGTGTTQSFYDVAKLFTDNINIIDFPNHLKEKYQYYSKADTTKLSNLINRNKNG